MQALFVNDLTGIEDLAIIDPVSLNGLIESSFDGHAPPRGRELYRVVNTAKLDFVIDGNIVRSQQGYALQLKMVNPKSAEVGFSHAATARMEEKLPAAVDTLSQHVLDFLEVEVLQSKEDRNLKPWFTTRNMGALKAFVQASQYNYRGDPATEKYLRRAIELDSSFISPKVWLIPKLVARGALPEANEHYHHLLALEARANPFEQVMIDWTGAFIKNEPAAQARYLTMALDYSPQNAILSFSLGRVRYLMQDYPGCIEALAPAVEMRWSYSPMYYLLGASHHQLKKYDEARNILEQSLSIKPVYPQTYCLLSTLWRKEADTTRARQYENLYINRAKESGTPLGNIYAALANWNHAESFFDNAIKYYRLALSLQPERPDHHQGLAEALYQKGDIETATQEYLRTLELDAANAGAHLKLGEISETKGETLKALAHYRAYLGLDSTSANAIFVKERVAKLQN